MRPRRMLIDGVFVVVGAPLVLLACPGVALADSSPHVETGQIVELSTIAFIAAAVIVVGIFLILRARRRRMSETARNRPTDNES
jgi:hypothetical protein